MGTTRQEETEEAKLCREEYGLHFSSGNDSTRAYQHLMKSVWEARNKIKEQESRIHRLTRTLQNIQKFMEHKPSEPPMSLKAGIILGWIEDGLGKESSPSRCHSFSSATTQTLDTHNTVECTTTRGYGDKESIIKTTRRKLVAMHNQQWRDRFEVKEKFFLAESYIQRLTTLTGSEYNPLEVLCILTECLPMSYREKIQVHKNAALGDWDLKQFRKAMMKVIRDDDEIHFPEDEEEEERNESLRTPMQPDAGPRNPWRLIDARSNLRPCIFCGARHLHWRCPLEPEARMRTILESGKCTQCLKVGHASKSCQEEGCRKCGGRHHTWIHNENEKRETLRICQGQQRNSYQAPSTSSNRWTEVHQVFLVPPPGRAASSNSPLQGTSPGATLPRIEPMYESLRPAETIQSWRFNRYQTKNQQPNVQE